MKAGFDAPAQGGGREEPRSKPTEGKAIEGITWEKKEFDKRNQLREGAAFSRPREGKGRAADRVCRRQSRCNKQKSEAGCSGIPILGAGEELEGKPRVKFSPNIKGGERGIESTL